MASSRDRWRLGRRAPVRSLGRDDGCGGRLDQSKNARKVPTLCARLDDGESETPFDDCAAAMAQGYVETLHPWLPARRPRTTVLAQDSAIAALGSTDSRCMQAGRVPTRTF